MNEYPKPVLRDPKYERWRWQTFAITWLAYAGFYLTRKGFSAAKVALGPGTAIDLSKGRMVATFAGLIMIPKWNAMPPRSE
jgi:sugar phosphate permease